MADAVQLTDLDVIQRFSLAVRSATADRAEVIAALRSDLAWLEGGRARSATSSPARTATRKAPTPGPAARKATAKKSVAKRAKKSVAKKSTRR